MTADELRTHLARLKSIRATYHLIGKEDLAQQMDGRIARTQQMIAEKEAGERMAPTAGATLEEGPNHVAQPA